MINTDFEKAFGEFRRFASIRYDEDWPVVEVVSYGGYMTISLFVVSNVLTQTELRTLLSACSVFELGLRFSLKESMLLVDIIASDVLILKFISKWLQ